MLLSPLSLFDTEFFFFFFNRRLKKGQEFDKSEIQGFPILNWIRFET